MFDILGVLGGIILLDLTLSGDNALIIGVAAARLPRQQRLYAFLFGGGLAIALRIIFASLATVVLNLPWIQTIGAVILLIVAIRLLSERAQTVLTAQKAQTQDQCIDKDQRKQQNFKNSFMAAILTIVAADVSMSLDNILAVGALANGEMLPLIIGLIVSIAIILGGSAIISELIARMVWLLDIAVLVIAWTSAQMIIDDLQTNHVLAHLPWAPVAIFVLAFGSIIAINILFHVRVHKSTNATV